MTNRPNNLSEWMQHTGVDADGLAKAAGVSARSVRNYVAGTSHPSVDVAQVIVASLRRIAGQRGKVIRPLTVDDIWPMQRR